MSDAERNPHVDNAFSDWSTKSAFHDTLRLLELEPGNRKVVAMALWVAFSEGWRRARDPKG